MRKRINQFILCILLFFTCCAPSNKNYVDGNTQITVEYYDEEIIGTCYPNLICQIKNNSKCVTLLYREAERESKKGLAALQEEDYFAASHYFSAALCNMYNLDNLFERMKSDNRQKWKVFNRSGFVERVRINAIKLTMLVKECQKMAVK